MVQMVLETDRATARRSVADDRVGSFRPCGVGDRIGLTSLRLQGPNGAKDEFLMAATVRELRTLAMTLPAPA